MTDALRFEIPVPAIYQAIEPKDPNFAYLIPMDYAVGGWLGDCLACDEYGRPDPGFPCATPLRAEAIGRFYEFLENNE